MSDQSVNTVGRQRRTWTPREDELLRNAVIEAMQQSRPLVWRELAKAVPGRTNKDCRRRWWNSLAGGTSKGPWSESEDERLLQAFAKYGPQWTRVAAAVETRHPDQCASHWTQVLDPAINHSDWTPKEDARLWYSVSAQGTKWASIAAHHVPKRPSLALKNRYTLLQMRYRSIENAGRISPSPLPSPTSIQASTTTDRPTIQTFGQYQLQFEDNDDIDDCLEEDIEYNDDYTPVMDFSCPDTSQTSPISANPWALSRDPVRVANLPANQSHNAYHSPTFTQRTSFTTGGDITQELFHGSQCGDSDWLANLGSDADDLGANRGHPTALDSETNEHNMDSVASFSSSHLATAQASEPFEVRSHTASQDNMDSPVALDLPSSSPGVIVTGGLSKNVTENLLTPEVQSSYRVNSSQLPHQQPARRVSLIVQCNTEQLGKAMGALISIGIPVNVRIETESASL